MHLAVVEIDLDVHHPIAGNDPFGASGVDPFLHRRHEDAIHVLPGQGLSEFNAGVAFLGFDAHPDFGELSRPAGLFLVPILRIGRNLNGLAIGNARLGHLEVHLEAMLEPFGHDPQVQFALARDHRLMQFGIDVEEEGRILLMQGGQAAGHLVLLPLGSEFESDVDVRRGVFDLGQGDDAFGAAKGVAGMGVLEFDGGADVARAQFAGGGAILAVEHKDLPHALGAFAIGIVEVHAAVDVAGVEPEVGEFAELRFAHGLEHVKGGVGVLEGDVHLLAGEVERADVFAIHGGRAVFGDEVHQTRHPDVALGVGAEQRNDGLFLDRGMFPCPELVLGETALGEELFQEFIVGFGGQFDEFLVQLEDALFVSAGSRGFGELPTAVGGVGDNSAAKHVEHLIETGTGIKRDVEGKDTVAEAGPALRQEGLEVHVLLVHRVEDDHLGNGVLGGVPPDLIGANVG